jgi:hypothetical protein
VDFERRGGVVECGGCWRHAELVRTPGSGAGCEEVTPDGGT